MTWPSPKPVASIIPSAVILHPKLREDVLVKKKGVTPKIVETLAMWVLLKTFLLCIRQDHGLGCFASNADIIKVNRMVAFIFQGYNNYGIVRYFFINRYIYT